MREKSEPDGVIDGMQKEEMGRNMLPTDRRMLGLVLLFFPLFIKLYCSGDSFLALLFMYEISISSLSCARPHDAHARVERLSAFLDG